MSWLIAEANISGLPNYSFYKAKKMIVDLKSADPDVLDAVIGELTRSRETLKNPESIDNVSLKSGGSADDSRSRKRSKRSSSVGSLSSVDTDVVERALNVDIHDLLRNEERDINELVDIRGEDLNGLFEKVYESLKREFDHQQCFPDDLQMEGVKIGYVRALIDAVRDYICDTFKIDNSRLSRREQVYFDFELDGEPEKIKADFVIMQEKPKKFYLAIVEVKKENCSYAIKQGLAYLYAVARENRDKVKFYALGSTGTHFNVIRLDPDGSYRLHKPIELMYGRMFDEGEKARWLNECTMIIRVIYSILCEKLQIPKVTVQ